MSHVVVAIITKEGNPDSYLLVSSNTDFGEFTGYYYPPSGHIEESETEEDALKREVFEELGLTITSSNKIADTAGDIHDQHTSWYKCGVENYDLVVDRVELRDARFFTQKEMLALPIWPATKAIFLQHIFL